MKYVFSLLFLFFLNSCISEKSSNTRSSTPTACECAKNTMKAGKPDYDKSLRRICEEYSATLTREEVAERAMAALECIKK